MSLIIIQTCEMCGKRRELAKGESEDLRGWRKLTSGNQEVTCCDRCLHVIVVHAQNRAAARKDNRPGTLNDRPLTLEFFEAE